MENYDLIRMEALAFLRNVQNKNEEQKERGHDKYYLDLFGDRKIIVRKIREELHNYYTYESKVIFLNTIEELVNIQHQLHLEGKATAMVFDSHKINTDNECDSCLAYKALLFYVKQELNELPKILKKNKSYGINKNRKKVFISYSHQDKDWLLNLKRHFKPFEKKIDFWDDSKIKPGQKWKQEIMEAIKDSKIAILLISADFFNSEFITENELPPLLEAAEKDGAIILSVIIKPCLFEEYPAINQFQAINSPTNTLIQMDEANRELTWVELVKQIKSLIDED